MVLSKDVTGYVNRLEGSRDNRSQGNTKVQRFINDAPTAMLVLAAMHKLETSCKSLSKPTDQSDFICIYLCSSVSICGSNS